MKKFLCLLFAVFVAVGLSACSSHGNEPENPDNTENPDNPDKPNPTGKTLIVYYSFTNNVHTFANTNRGRCSKNRTSRRRS